MRDILTALEVDEEIDNLEEEVAIIKYIAEVLERKQKDKLKRYVPKRCTNKEVITGNC